ncbi:MAG TPA: UbiA family prenyltransferase, partial [Anaerolineales bacterium]|nr:UbiA family prenyltransferase [Anaerolineales bacterium]
ILLGQVDMNTAKQIAIFIRWRDWGPGKLTLLWVVCLYLAVAYEIRFEEFVSIFVIFLCFAAAQAALGYVLNDWGDRDLDRRQFKRNAFSGRTRLESILALLLIMIMALVAGAPLLLRRGFGLLWFAWALSAAAYSLSPMRLKTRGLVGLVAASIAQWLLPVLITFAAFEVAGGEDMWLIALGLTASGAALELGRQRFNRDRNLLTNTGTYAASLSFGQLQKRYALALALDKLAVILVGLVFLSALEISWTMWSQVFVTVLGALYLLALMYSLVGLWQALRQGRLGESGSSAGETRQVFMHGMNNMLLTLAIPIALGGMATLRIPAYALVLGFYLLWWVGLVGIGLNSWPPLFVSISKAGRGRRR